MTRWSTPPRSALPSGPRPLAEQVALTFLAGPWHEEALVRRGGRLLGHRPRWLRSAARAVLGEYPGPERPEVATLVVAIMGHPAFHEAIYRRGYLATMRVRLGRWWRNWRGRPWRWNVPELCTVGQVAALLDVAPTQLDWLADPGYWERRTETEPLRNYHYRWVKKRPSGLRLLEVPKPRLKLLQRRVLDNIVANIPPHDAAHGFRPGRSVRTFAAPHAGQAVVIRLDLADFFPSISGYWIRAVFRAAGYNDRVAALLAGLCTTAAPPDVWQAVADQFPRDRLIDSRRLFHRPHLPQGAPTSPALANLCAWGLDRRLAALAHAAGARYTRYADDLLFSGPESLARSSQRFVVHAAAIALEEGFSIAFRKTRVMRRGVRQHAAGVVLNERPQLPRSEYDQLKAILHNCQRHGAASQNRAGVQNLRAHLAGRISYLAQFHPERGAKLWDQWRRISW